MGLDGVSIGSAAGAANVKLFISPGLSSSSVRLSREFGSVSVEQCKTFERAFSQLRANELDFSTFKANIQQGKYFVSNSAETCKQVGPIDEGITTIQEFMNKYWRGDQERWSALPAMRIRPIGVMGDFSLETKIVIKPSLPFAITAHIGSEKTIDIPVKTMTLYHPCPVRIENNQYDAVLSLNDPGNLDSSDIILVPIKADSIPDDRASFFSRILPYISGLMEPNIATGEYTPIDVPTGNDWSLTKLIPVENDIKSGFFTWVGEGTTNPVRYYLLEQPVPISAFDLATLRTFPMTPPTNAIHGIPRKFYYKTGPPSASMCARQGQGEGVCETFCGTPECDPMSALNVPDSTSSQDSLVAVFTTLLVTFGIAIAVYIAVKFAASNYPDIFKRIGERIGRAIGGGNIKAAMKAVTVATASPMNEEELLPERLRSELTPEEKEQEQELRRQEDIERVREAEEKAQQKKREAEERDLEKRRRRTRRRDVTPSQAETMREVTRRIRPAPEPRVDEEDQRAPAPPPAEERLPVSARVTNPMRAPRPAPAPAPVSARVTNPMRSVLAEMNSPEARQRDAEQIEKQRAALNQYRAPRPPPRMKVAQETRGSLPAAPPNPPVDARRPKRRKIAFETPDEEELPKPRLSLGEQLSNVGRPELARTIKTSEAVRAASEQRRAVDKKKGGKKGRKHKHTIRRI
jgi:hypothetical protein